MRSTHWILFSLVSTLVFVSGVRATPLVYDVDEAESSLTAGLGVSVGVTFFVPGREPGETTLSDGTVLDVALTGSAVIDTGLPEDFDDGANGLEIASFTAGAQAAEGETLVTLSDASLLHDPISGGNALASMTAEVHAISIILNAPVATTLVPTATAGLYTWGPVEVSATVGMDVTLSGGISPYIPEIELWDGPVVADDFLVPIEGTFEGTPDGTQLTLTADMGDLVFGTLIEPGGYFTFDVGVEATKIEIQVLATNPTTIPEPSQALLALFALTGVAAVRSPRRARSSRTRSRTR